MVIREERRRGEILKADNDRPFRIGRVTGRDTQSHQPRRDWLQSEAEGRVWDLRQWSREDHAAFSTCTAMKQEWLVTRQRLTKEGALAHLTH